ncbi:hypothetical protein V8B55DRAFT_1463924 [Mucor lusitanicus]|uniref:F-box domain-containing protein n=2 Tax=Mucor circinelloides f. lusitanicus TaxID=29924 RepID=A0A162QQU1_MUCCL|nr:hypothetical protein FB192DRAFT_1354774 [Mucor lusitanicus]OAD01459.1 hypothetical protein MUCCIDRAFT_165336 [Mucor lusitanicus CBS 277.49]
MKAKLPPEFLQQVAAYLSLQDCTHALYVCKLWFHTFQRSVYRKIYIYNQHQLRQLIASLTQSYDMYQHSYHNGLMVREIYLLHEQRTSVLDPRHDEEGQQQHRVHLSQENFDLLAKLCPELEVLDFDIAQWQHLTLNPATHTWKYMRQCAPIHYVNFAPRFLTTFSGTKLSHLHLSHQPEDLDALVGSLQHAPNLEHLTLEMNYSDNDTAIAASPSLSSCLQRLHAHLARLKSFNLIRTKTPHQESSAASHDPHFLSTFAEPCYTLQSLSLHGHVDSYRWFDFIGSSYPQLRSLSLTQLTTSRFGTKWMWQNALVHMIQSLPSLKSLTLGGKNAPQLFSKGFAVELRKPTCSIDDLYVDFQTYQAIESCQFLLLVQSYGLAQLKFLRLRVWEQIPGWSGVTSNLFHCKKLQTLELSLSKGLMDQFPFTPFLIDHLLGHLPQLENLALVGANVQVTYNNYVDLDKGTFGLKKLELRQSKIENHEAVFMYLSFCCPHMDTLVLGKCEIERKRQQQLVLPSSTLNTCSISMPYSRLSRVTLSSFLIYLGTIQSNDYIGIELVTEQREQSVMVWCETIKTEGIQIYPSYGLCEDQDKNAELTDLYRTYRSPSTAALTPMPGNFTPNIGIITLHCKALLSGIALDHLKIPSKHFNL